MPEQIVRSYVIAQIKGLLEKAKSLREMNHPGTKGLLREIFLTELIRPFLPPHIGIGSGIIVNSSGRQSNQTDVIMYDTRLLQPWATAEGRGVFPIESVLATIEVKSSVTTRDLTNWNGSINYLISEVWYGHDLSHQGLAAYLFAYDGSLTTELDHSESGKEWLRDRLENPKGFCVVNRWSWMNLAATNWTLEEADSETHKEVRRFLAILLDNLRARAERKWTFLASTHHDWLGAYIRD